MAFDAPHWNPRFVGNVNHLDKYAIRLTKKATPIEKKVKKYLEEMHLPFAFQYVIHPYIVDFVDIKRKLIIECDGQQWHSSPKQRLADANRDLALGKLGYRVLHLLGWQCWNTPVCKGLIIDFLKDSGSLEPSANGPVLSETSIIDKTAKTEGIKAATDPLELKA